MHKWTAIILIVTCLSACSDRISELNGYWQLDLDPNSRILTQTVIWISNGEVTALTYFAGPMLNQGMNTQESDYKLMGSVRCGLVEDSGGLRIEIINEKQLHQQIGREINEVYLLTLDADGSMMISASDGPIVGRYVKVTDLRPGEAQGLLGCQ